MKVDNRLWYLGSALVVIGVVAGGWAVGISPQLTAADESQATLVSTQAQNAQATAKLGTLQTLQSDRAAKEDELADAEAKIPTGIDGSGFLAQVNSASSDASTTITNVSLGAAVPYTVPTTAVPAAGTAVSGTSAGAAASKSKIDTSKLLPYTNPLITPTKLLVVPVSISASGTQSQLEKLLSNLRDMKRELLITQFNLQGSSTGLQLIVTANIYTVVQ